MLSIDSKFICEASRINRKYGLDSINENITFTLMKKVALSLTLFMFSATAFSQTGFGIKVGGMISTKTVGDLNRNLELTKASYLGGVFYSIPFSEQLGLQLELLYANKGISEPDQFLIREDLHYLNLPVMLQYAITKRFGVEIGPEIGYLLEQKQIFRSGTQPGSPAQKSFDMAVNLGVNYALVEKVFLSLRYNVGIYDTIKPFNEFFPDRLPQEDPFTGNRTLQFSLGYRISQ